jgi:RimJ/RimL family protein N-acetyltransferase
MPELDDLTLLAIEHEGVLDPRGRIIGLYGATLARTASGDALWIGADVPEPEARALDAAFEALRPATPPSEPPTELIEACARILGERAPRRASGLAYLVEPGTRFASDARILVSNAPELRGANPGNWEPLEWDELLDGKLGPWAIAIERGAAVSIAHTCRILTPRSAECGVWTHPDTRGRGLAAAVTAAWAALLHPTGRHVFYSTSAENVSSQRVAQRLGLRLLGRTWHVGQAYDTERDRIHPASALRDRA